MSRVEIVKVELDDGQTALAEVVVPAGGDVGMRDRAGLRLADFANRLSEVSRTLVSAVRNGALAAPSGIEVEFGVRLAVETGRLTSVLAHASSEATVLVRLSWSSADGPAAGKSASP